jgi:hypothetical protein
VSKGTSNVNISKSLEDLVQLAIDRGRKSLD